MIIFILFPFFTQNLYAKIPDQLLEKATKYVECVESQSGKDKREKISIHHARFQRLLKLLGKHIEKGEEQNAQIVAKQLQVMNTLPICKEKSEEIGLLYSASISPTLPDSSCAQMTINVPGIAVPQQINDNSNSKDNSARIENINILMEILEKNKLYACENIFRQEGEKNKTDEIGTIITSANNLDSKNKLENISQNIRPINCSTGLSIAQFIKRQLGQLKENTEIKQILEKIQNGSWDLAAQQSASHLAPYLSQIHRMIANISYNQTSNKQTNLKSIGMLLFAPILGDNFNPQILQAEKTILEKTQTDPERLVKINQLLAESQKYDVEKLVTNICNSYAANPINISVDNKCMDPKFYPFKELIQSDKKYTESIEKLSNILNNPQIKTCLNKDNRMNQFEIYLANLDLIRKNGDSFQNQLQKVLEEGVTEQRQNLMNNLLNSPLTDQYMGAIQYAGLHAKELDLAVQKLNKKCKTIFNQKFKEIAPNDSDITYLTSTSFQRLPRLNLLGKELKEDILIAKSRNYSEELNEQIRQLEQKELEGQNQQKIKKPGPLGKISNFFKKKQEPETNHIYIK